MVKRDAGESPEQIAERRLIQGRERRRRYYQRNKAKTLARNQAYLKARPGLAAARSRLRRELGLEDKYKYAHQLLRLAITQGKVTRPSVCSECGVACIPEGHHHDYSKPREVTWYCKPCHRKEHDRLREAAGHLEIRTTTPKRRKGK